MKPLNPAVFVATLLVAISTFCPGTTTRADDAAADTNALLNPSMTDGTDVPTHWTGAFGDIKATRDTTTFHSTPAALCVTCTDGKSGQAFQTLDGLGGKTITLSGFVKCAGNAKVNVAIQSFDEHYTKNQFDQIKYVQNDNDWTDFSKQVAIPAWASHCNVLLLVDGNGKAWIDDVKLSGAGNAPAEAPADPLTSGPPATAAPDQPGWGFYPPFPQAWRNFHNGFLERTKKAVAGADAPRIDVLFLGDSITQGWDADIWKEHFEPLHAVNYGIGGDSTRQVLWRINNGEVDGISPKLVVLMIGTNNLYNDFNAGSDEQIAAGITKIVITLQTKLPKTKILLCSILPRQNDWFCGRISRINAITAKLDDGQKVRVLDMTAAFESSPGSVHAELFHDDKLHPVKAGYEVWVKQMQPLLDQMLR